MVFIEIAPKWRTIIIYAETHKFIDKRFSLHFMKQNCIIFYNAVAAISFNFWRNYNTICGSLLYNLYLKTSNIIK